MTRVWGAVRRFGAKYPVWAGVAAVAGVALLVGGGYAVAQVGGSSGANRAAGVSPAVEATSSGGPTDVSTSRPDVSVSPSSSPSASPSASRSSVGGPHLILIESGEHFRFGGWSVSADGSRLAYAYEDDNPDGAGFIERTFAVDLRSMTSVEVNVPGGAFQGNSSVFVSPDGKHVAISKPPAVCSAITGECVEVSDDGATYHSLEWSPDSSRFVATKYRPNSQNQTVVVDASTHGERVVAEGWEAAWSNDGTRLAWVQRDGRTEEVWTQALDDGIATRLFPAPGASPSSDPLERSYTTLAWSHDDARLAVAFSTPAGAEVHVVSADGGTSQPVTGLANLSSVAELGWSADGAYVAFVGLDYTSDTIFADAQYVYVASSSSLVATALAADSAQYPNWNIAWSPYGHLLGAVNTANSWGGGDTFPWFSWPGEGTAMTSVDPRCTSQPRVPQFVPREDGGAPTQAVGYFECPNAEPGFYLMELGT